MYPTALLLHLATDILCLQTLCFVFTDIMLCNYGGKTMQDEEQLKLSVQ